MATSKSAPILSPVRPAQKKSQRRAGRWRKLALLGLALLVLDPSDALAADSANSVDQPKASILTQQVLRATLTNGLRVIVIRNPLAPVVSTVLNYCTGSDEPAPGFPGTAHALEHMMFRGSPGLSADQLADLSAALGGESNADTQQTVTQYFFTVPAQDLDVTLHLESLRMQGILATPSLWAQERGAIEQEVAQDLSNPDYLFYTKLLAALFKSTPYEHDALGTRPSFEATTAAHLQEFFRAWYTPNNAILVIAGDLQPDQALLQVKHWFEPIASRPLPSRPEFHFQPVQPETLGLETDSPYGMAVFAFRFPGSESADYAAVQVLGDVLSSQRGPLYGLVPAGKALGASFSYDDLPKAGIGFATAQFPAGADPMPLLAEMRTILASQSENVLGPDLVEAAKRREVARAELQRTSIPGLAMEWAQAVAVEGRDSPQEDIDAIRQVTAGDVLRVSKKYLTFDHAITAILTPQPSGQPLSPKGFGGAESFTPTQVKPVALPEWGAQAASRLEIPSTTTHPIVTNLPNGLKLIVQPASISDTISVYGRVKNTLQVQVPSGQEGVSAVLDELFAYGTTNLDRLAFQKALDDIGAEESAGASFSLQVLADHFDRGVELLAGNMLAPALPEEAFKTIQPELAAAVAGQLQSPGYLAQRALEKSVFPKSDPVQREPTPATVRALTIDDVRAYYRNAFRPDLSTIVVIGKITPSNAQAVMTKYFGGWHATGPKPNTLFPPAPANHPAVVQVPDASRSQDKVLLAQTLNITRTNADYYALELGNHILGGAFYATRLYRDLRENAGLVYFVSSQFEVGQTRGVYMVDYACGPPNVAKARLMITSELNDMKQHLVEDRELRQAKVLLLRQVPLSESSFDRIAAGWLSRVTLELPLDEPIRAAHRYLELDAPAVRSAFSKWLRPDDLVQVTQGPEPK